MQAWEPKEVRAQKVLFHGREVMISQPKYLRRLVLEVGALEHQQKLIQWEKYKKNSEFNLANDC